LHVTRENGMLHIIWILQQAMLYVIVLHAAGSCMSTIVLSDKIVSPTCVCRSLDRFAYVLDSAASVLDIFVMPAVKAQGCQKTIHMPLHPDA
jgi:hypothetical protein